MRSTKVGEWRRERNGEKRADPRRRWGAGAGVVGGGEENDPLRTEVLAQLGHEWAARLALPLVLPIPTARQKEAQRRGEAGQRGWKTSRPALPNSAGPFWGIQGGAVIQARLREVVPCYGKTYRQS